MWRWLGAFLLVSAFVVLTGPPVQASTAVDDICWFEIDGGQHCEPGPPPASEDDAWAILYSLDPDLAAQVQASPSGEVVAMRSSCFQTYYRDIYSCYETYYRDWGGRNACYLDAAVDLIGCVRRGVIGR
jgi:hypothetical protein